MPKRRDIHKILIIGSGPIIIGQACEFDYSGAQACKALREEGYKVVLVNSNPATIMTDPELAHRTYIEPITPEIVEKIIAVERPDALLPTLGGQTALNTTVALGKRGVFKKYKVEVIGASLSAIHKAEDRKLFKNAMKKIGLDLPKSGFVYAAKDAEKLSKKMGFPLIIRPSFTMGGTGGGIAYNLEELQEIVANGISQSQIGQVLVEESVIGWKEFELEVMRDQRDNVVIVCSIENFDPMGVHTGDSITVAPAQTLTDKEYQRLRDYSIRCIREIGVDTGGSNIQFAVHPETGRVVIIEMNPRVSRSSALASKATGFPIAKIAAKLAVGYTLDEIPNDITKKTPASFEPAIDYVVVKVPRFAFEKFPGADQTLNTQMKSVGEAMAIGRTFKEAIQKALRSLEVDWHGLEDPPEMRGAHWVKPEQLSLGEKPKEYPRKILSSELLERKLRIPNFERILYIKAALKKGWSIEDIARMTHVDPWFLQQLSEIVEMEKKLLAQKIERFPKGLDVQRFREAKRMGFSDLQLAEYWGVTELAVRQARKNLGILPAFKIVDTCAAEFQAATPYFYSTYDSSDEPWPSDRKKVMILGGGPNRIGQGIEFDYCCVHASFALKEEGLETIMVNCNPETVSTDYDTSDRLYFEPMTFEDVMNIIDREKPWGVIVQFGGQTPLKLAVPLQQAGVRLLGTSSESIDIAEDRERFEVLLQKLDIPRPPNGIAKSFEEANVVASKIGYPILVRPSYVLGGRAMEIVYDEKGLEIYMREATRVSPKHPILIDRFLEDAVEVDVDAVSDGKITLIAGIMEHVEEAGIHSGDSACVLPPHSLSEGVLQMIREYTSRLSKALRVVGLMNVQYAVKEGVVYVLEVNPRASRTVPFVSKATGVPWAKVAAKVMAGRSLKSLGVSEQTVQHISVKEAVLPFSRFTQQDIVLGPEMKSTGEVMGIGKTFGEAFAKAQMGAGETVPLFGRIFISVQDHHKAAIIPIARDIQSAGLDIVATSGTAQILSGAGIKVSRVKKVGEGRPNIVDRIVSGGIQLVINTPIGKGPRADDYAIRRAALLKKVLCVTTIPGAAAIAQGIRALRNGNMSVTSLQDYFRGKTVSLTKGKSRARVRPIPNPHGKG